LTNQLNPFILLVVDCVTYATLNLARSICDVLLEPISIQAISQYWERCSYNREIPKSLSSRLYSCNITN